MALSEATNTLLQTWDPPSLIFSLFLPLALPREALSIWGYQREDEPSNPTRPYLSRVQVIARDPRR